MRTPLAHSLAFLLVVFVFSTAACSSAHVADDRIPVDPTMAARAKQVVDPDPTGVLADASGDTAKRLGLTWWEAHLRDAGEDPDVAGIVTPGQGAKIALAYTGHKADGTAIVTGQIKLDLQAQFNVLQSADLETLRSIFAGSQLGPYVDANGSSTIPTLSLSLADRDDLFTCLLRDLDNVHAITEDPPTTNTNTNSNTNTAAVPGAALRMHPLDNPNGDSANAACPAPYHPGEECRQDYIKNVSCQNDFHPLCTYDYNLKKNVMEEVITSMKGAIEGAVLQAAASNECRLAVAALAGSGIVAGLASIVGLEGPVVLAEAEVDRPIITKCILSVAVAFFTNISQQVLAGHVGDYLCSLRMFELPQIPTTNPIEDFIFGLVAGNLDTFGWGKGGQLTSFALQGWSELDQCTCHAASGNKFPYREVNAAGAVACTTCPSDGTHTSHPVATAVGCAPDDPNDAMVECKIKGHERTFFVTHDLCEDMWVTNWIPNDAFAANDNADSMKEVFVSGVRIPAPPSAGGQGWGTDPSLMNMSFEKCVDLPTKGITDLCPDDLCTDGGVEGTYASRNPRVWNHFITLPGDVAPLPGHACGKRASTDPDVSGDVVSCIDSRPAGYTVGNARNVEPRVYWCAFKDTQCDGAKPAFNLDARLPEYPLGFHEDTCSQNADYNNTNNTDPSTNDDIKLYDSCTGLAAGVYCSQLAPYSSIVCSGPPDFGIVAGIQCDAPDTSHCVGPNGPGTEIKCASN